MHTEGIHPTPLMWTGFVAAATAIVALAYSPLIAVALRVMG